VTEVTAILRGRPRGGLETVGSICGCLRGRPRGRLGREGSKSGRVRGRPLRFGSTQAGGAMR
jgi:hypothetical protein